MNRHPSTAILVLTLSFFLLPARASAGFTFEEVLETMMEAQADTSLIVGHVFGPDNATTLHFTSNFNLDTRSFAFSLLPGQTYLGQSISLSTVGTYNSVEEQYEWTVDGVVGGESLAGTGSLIWVGDPEGTDKTTVTLGGKEYTVTSKLNVDLVSATQFTSTGEYTLTGPADGPGGPGPFGPYPGTDKSKDGGFEHRIKVPKNPVTPTGEVIFMTGLVPAPPGGFPPPGGTFPSSFFDVFFDVHIGTIPEPSSFMIASIGVIALGGCGFVKRHRQAKNRA